MPKRRKGSWSKQAKIRASERAKARWAIRKAKQNVLKSNGSTTITQELDEIVQKANHLKQRITQAVGG